MRLKRVGGLLLILALVGPWKSSHATTSCDDKEVTFWAEALNTVEENGKWTTKPYLIQIYEHWSPDIGPYENIFVEIPGTEKIQPVQWKFVYERFAGRLTRTGKPNKKVEVLLSPTEKKNRFRVATFKEMTGSSENWPALLVFRLTKNNKTLCELPFRVLVEN